MKTALKEKRSKEGRLMVADSKNLGLTTILTFKTKSRGLCFLAGRIEGNYFRRTGKKAYSPGVGGLERGLPKLTTETPRVEGDRDLAEGSKSLQSSGGQIIGEKGRAAQRARKSRSWHRHTGDGGAKMRRSRINLAESRANHE